MLDEPPRSTVPYWLTACFTLGLGVGRLAFRPSEQNPFVAEKKVPSLTPQTATALAPVAPGPLAQPVPLGAPATFAQVEACFSTWGGYAIWEDDVAEFALRSTAVPPAEYFAVTRAGGKFYFRALRQLTRPLIDHGTPVRCPTAFTETQAMHDAYYQTHAGPRGRTTVYDWAAADAAPLLPPRPPVAASAPSRTSAAAASSASSPRAIIAELLETSARAGSPISSEKASDLVAIVAYNNVPPLRDSASVAERRNYVAQRKAATESALGMATALLKNDQLDLLRKLLNRDIDAPLASPATPQFDPSQVANPPVDPSQVATDSTESPTSPPRTLDLTPERTLTVLSYSLSSQGASLTSDQSAKLLALLRANYQSPPPLSASLVEIDSYVTARKEAATAVQSAARAFLDQQQSVLLRSLLNYQAGAIAPLYPQARKSASPAPSG